MQIHELNTKALTDPAYIAFDDGTDTYKADFTQVIDDAVAEAFTSADVSGGVVNYTSGDAASPTAWTDVSVMSSGSTLATLMNRISTMVKNVRYIWSKLGTTDISSIGGGTVTGAISSFNGKIGNVTHGQISNINNVSNYDMVANNIIPKGGNSIIFLAASNAVANAASIYFARATVSGTVYFTVIHEGSSNSAPILSGNGILNTRAEPTALTVGYEIMRLL